MNQARQVFNQIKNANGPAQHVTFAIWGMIMAGMYAGLGPSLWLVTAWFLTSMAMIPTLLFMPRIWLERVILIDVMQTTAVLTLYLTHEAVHHPMYSSAHNVWDSFAHIAGPIFMILHGVYLANLVQRQRLEKLRFVGTVEVFEDRQNAD